MGGESKWNGARSPGGAAVLESPLVGEWLGDLGECGSEFEGRPESCPMQSELVVGHGGARRRQASKVGEGDVEWMAVGDTRVTDLAERIAYPEVPARPEE